VRRLEKKEEGKKTLLLINIYTVLLHKCLFFPAFGGNIVCLYLLF